MGLGGRHLRRLHGARHWSAALRYRAHQAQSVGDLDDDDTRIFGHRHEHLAQRVGVLLALPLASAPPLAGGVIWLGAALGVALGAAAQGNRRALKCIEALQAGDGLRDLLAKRAAELCCAPRPGR